jgi:hypothetical protein
MVLRSLAGPGRGLQYPGLIRFPQWNNQFSPGGGSGCGCCEEVEDPCILVNDPFDRDDADALGGTWTEHGDIDIVSNEARVQASVTAYAISSVTHAGNIRITMDVRSQIAGGEFWIIIAWVDDDNYLYAQLKIGTSQTIKLFKRVAGSDTELESATQTTAAATIYEFWACYRNGLFSAGVTGGTSTYAVLWSPSVTLGSFGFGADAVGGNAFINDFIAEKVQDGCAVCELGEEVTCENCIGGSAARWYLIELNNFVSDWCPECELWNDGWILGTIGCSSLLTTGANQPPCGNDVGLLANTPFISFVLDTDRITVRVGVANPGFTVIYQLARFELMMEEEPYDCFDLDRLEIPLIETSDPVSGGTDPICDTTGATCHVTAL